MDKVKELEKVARYFDKVALAGGKIKTSMSVRVVNPEKQYASVGGHMANFYKCQIFQGDRRFGAHGILAFAKALGFVNSKELEAWMCYDKIWNWNGKGSFSRSSQFKIKGYSREDPQGIAVKLRLIAENFRKLEVKDKEKASSIGIGD